MKNLVVLVVVSFLLIGCGVIPKRVEFGQDKVQTFPVAKEAEKEVQRQAAQRAALKSEEVLVAAIVEEASPAVVEPAKEAAVLTGAVSTSLGPPEKPSPVTESSVKLAQRLDTAVARLNRRIDDFAEGNNENAGKKIEGTGFLQVPYFVWLGGVAVFGFFGLILVGVAWTALKAFAILNPPVALGVKAIQTGGSLAAKSVGQLVKGGERFKGWLKSEVPEISDEVRVKIEDLFRSAHKESQDESVQNIVKELTR